MLFCNPLQLSQSNQAENAAIIFDTLVDYLCSEHIDYALEIGLQGIASHEPKVEPATYFFDVASQANAIFHLLEKQFSDILVPLIRYVRCANPMMGGFVCVIRGRWGWVCIDW